MSAAERQQGKGAEGKVPELQEHLPGSANSATARGQSAQGQLPGSAGSAVSQSVQDDMLKAVVVVPDPTFTDGKKEGTEEVIEPISAVHACDTPCG